MIVLRGAGIELAGVAFDTMIASYLLEAGRRNHNLDELAQTYLHHETIKISELIGKGKDQRRMDEVRHPPRGRLRRRRRLAAGAAAADPGRRSSTRPMTLGRGLLRCDLELPLIDVLAELEYNGIKVDVARLGELSRRYGQRMESLEAEIHQTGGPAVEHRLAQAASRAVVQRVEAAGGEARRPRRAPAPTPRCWRSWPRCTRCRPRFSNTGSTPN